MEVTIGHLKKVVSGQSEHKAKCRIYWLYLVLLYTQLDSSLSINHYYFLVFKTNQNSPSFWYLGRGTFSNFQVFSYILSEEAMEARTAGGEGCDSPGDYLR